MLWFELKSSRVRACVRMLGLDFARVWDVIASVDDADAIDPHLIDLVVQLCTRIGMIMEDVSPVAIDASSDGLARRVTELVHATRSMTSLANAAETLMER